MLGESAALTIGYIVPKTPNISHQSPDPGAPEGLKFRVAAVPACRGRHFYRRKVVNSHCGPWAGAALGIALK